MTDARTYRLVRFLSPNDRWFADAIQIYIRNIQPRMRTDTDEIAYWLDRFNEEGDEFYVFGFLLDETPIGFGMAAYFGDAEFFIFDYLVIEQPYRKNNTFYEFVDQVTTFLQNAKPQYRYAVVEVGRMSDTDEPSDDSRKLIRLLKQQGFAVVRAPYIVPRLGLVNIEAEMRTDLLILTRESLPSLHVDTYRRIVRTIYFRYYERWYAIDADHSRAYHEYLQQLYEKVANSVSGTRVPINGYKQSLSLPSPPLRPHAHVLHFTGWVLFYIGAFTAILVLLKHELALTDASFTSIYLLVLVTIFGVMSVVSRDARVVFYRILSFARDIWPFFSQNKTKLQAKSRKPGTRRAAGSKALQRDAAQLSDEKRSRNDDSR